MSTRNARTHGDQLTIPGEYPPDTYTPKAQKEQLTVADWDHVLVGIARSTNPRVFWWWGTRNIGQRTGARCYICNDWIVGYDRNWPITTQALRTIEIHRVSHYGDAVAAIGKQA